MRLRFAAAEATGISADEAIDTTWLRYAAGGPSTSNSPSKASRQSVCAKSVTTSVPKPQRCVAVAYCSEMQITPLRYRLGSIDQTLVI